MGFSSVVSQWRTVRASCTTVLTQDPSGSLSMPLLDVHCSPSSMAKKKRGRGPTPHCNRCNNMGTNQNCDYLIQRRLFGDNGACTPCRREGIECSNSDQDSVEDQHTMNPPGSVGLPMNMAPYHPQPLAPYYPQPLAPYQPPQPAPYYPPQPAPHHPPNFPPHQPPFQAHPPQGFWQNGVYWQAMPGYQQPPQPQQQPAPPPHSQGQTSRDAWYGAIRDDNNALDHPSHDRGYGQDTRPRRWNSSHRSRSPNARARDISPPRHRQRDDHFGRWDHSRRQPSPSAHSRGDAVKAEKSEELCRYFQRGKCRNGDECYRIGRLRREGLLR